MKTDTETSTCRVVQEYVLSPQAIVICGTLSAPMQMFSIAMEYAAKNGGGCCQKSWARLRSNQANDMMLLWRKIKDLGQPQDVRDWAKLYRILLYHRNRKASDPRVSPPQAAEDSHLLPSGFSTAIVTRLTIFGSGYGVWPIGTCAGHS